MDGRAGAGTRAATSWDFACPICGTALRPEGEDVRCTGCDRLYRRLSGIWRFLPEERAPLYERFLREYRIVRAEQGWGRADASYFLALPSVAPDDPHREIWRRRSESRRVLLAEILQPMAARRQRTLRIADLGAGNCWLAYGLCTLGHRVAAVDLSLDEVDGLGAHRWYGPEVERRNYPPFTPIQAEFDRLPLADRVLDLVVFNASLHYAADCAVTLREALRVLAPDGTLVIMDSPVYRHASSGERMVLEREQALDGAHGFRSNSLPAEHFLTTGRLEELARDLGLHWQIHSLIGSKTRVVRTWRRVRGLRELAELPVIAGSRV